MSQLPHMRLDIPRDFPEHIDRLNKVLRDIKTWADALDPPPPNGKTSGLGEPPFPTMPPTSISTIQAGGGIAVTGSAVSPLISVSGLSTADLSDFLIATWTPEIFGQGSAGVVTYTIQDGQYVKIGKFIFASVYIRWTAIAGMAGDVSITLPASPTVLTSTNYFPEGAIGDIDGITLPVGTTWLTVEAQESTSRMDIFANGSGLTAGNLQATALAGAGYLLASVAYLTN